MAARLLNLDDGLPLDKDHSIKLIESAIAKAKSKELKLFHPQFVVEDDSVRELLVMRMTWPGFGVLHNINNEFEMETLTVDVDGIFTGDEGQEEAKAKRNMLIKRMSVDMRDGDDVKDGFSKRRGSLKKESSLAEKDEPKRRGSLKKEESIKEKDEPKSGSRRGSLKKEDSVKEKSDSRRGSLKKEDSVKEKSDSRRGSLKKEDSVKEKSDSRRGSLKKEDSVKETDVPKSGSRRGSLKKEDSVKEKSDSRRGSLKKEDSVKEKSDSRRGSLKKEDSLKETEKVKKQTSKDKVDEKDTKDKESPTKPEKVKTDSKTSDLLDAVGEKLSVEAAKLDEQETKQTDTEVTATEKLSAKVTKTDEANEDVAKTEISAEAAGEETAKNEVANEEEVKTVEPEKEPEDILVAADTVNDPNEEEVETVRRKSVSFDIPEDEDADSSNVDENNNQTLDDIIEDNQVPDDAIEEKEVQESYSADEMKYSGEEKEYVYQPTIAYEFEKGEISLNVEDEEQRIGSRYTSRYTRDLRRKRQRRALGEVNPRDELLGQRRRYRRKTHQDVVVEYDTDIFAILKCIKEKTTRLLEKQDRIETVNVDVNIDDYEY